MNATLVTRLDNIGDVLLAGPAVRAVAAAGRRVVMLTSASGAAAARLLPGVDEVVTFEAPWVSFDAPCVERAAIDALIADVAARDVDDALILTSYHQSPLPLALVLRMAGVARLGATCVDYPGRLLDIRHPYLEAVHEVEQALSLCEVAGYPLPPDDDRRLRIDVHPPGRSGGRYVVVHPGASVPARALPVAEAAAVVTALSQRGHHVIVTGSAEEKALAEQITEGADMDRVDVVAGTTDLVGLAELIAGAEAVVCGNTGTAHIAAAVGTPVIEAFAPVVPAVRWHPWMVPHELLGVLDIECAGCRARQCPFPGQPCLRPFTADAVLDALDRIGRRS